MSLLFLRLILQLKNVFDTYNFCMLKRRQKDLCSQKCNSFCFSWLFFTTLCVFEGMKRYRPEEDTWKKKVSARKKHLSLHNPSKHTMLFWHPSDVQNFKKYTHYFCVCLFGSTSLPVVFYIFSRIPQVKKYFFTTP